MIHNRRALNLPSTHQNGVALIAALIIVGLVTALAIGLATTHDRTLLLAESRFHGNQAQEYLLGAEELGRFALEKDFESDREDNELVDSLEEPWAQEQPFPLDEGFLKGQLEDAQGKFDVNRLAVQNQDNGTGDTSPERYTSDQKRFIRLLQLLDEENPMSISDAIEILQPIIDWIDPDDDSFGFSGAESLEYQREDPPIRPANGPLKSVSELRLVKSMTPELFDALEPYITALPDSNGLNVNTAKPLLLRTINLENDLTPLSKADGEQMLLDRAGSGYIGIAEFLDSGVISSLTPLGTVSSNGLTVNTSYFTLKAEVEVGRQRRTQYSLILRDNGDAKIIQRSDFNL
ncbi:GspK family T2SS minor pseudopilin variant XcpX [Sessilibacter sp. MAH1]